MSFGANALFIEGGGNIIANENGADADFRIESDSNTHAFFVNGEFKSVIGMATSSPVSYANGDTVLYLHGADNPAIALSDNGQTRDYFITAQGSSLNINYADGSNSSSASNVTTLATFDNSGSVGIGNTDPAHRLDLKTSNIASSSDYAVQAIAARIPLISGYNNVINSGLAIYDNTIHAVDVGYQYNVNSSGGYDLVFLQIIIQVEVLLNAWLLIILVT